MRTKPRIAHIAGSNATVLNTPPLVTSNKAREKYGLPLLQDESGNRTRYDVLRPQRLAAPATIYIEQFSAHPLESDAAELYGPPDGYIDRTGTFRRERTSEGDKPVYEVTLHPDDGLYPLPYMARQADGSAWEEECAYPAAPAASCRQPFYPDGARLFEEIDRFGISDKGHGSLICSQTEVDFFRIAPPAGFKKGLKEPRRTDVGFGDIPPEAIGRDFFPYRPFHLAASPTRSSLVDITNGVQRILSMGKYAGAIWSQGSPRIEETAYWLNCLIDSPLPICGVASQRKHGMVGNDGDKNIVDAIEFIMSRVWADDFGRDRLGVVLIQDQQIFAARDVQKADARPGGYTITGGHGGILGAVGHGSRPVITYVSTRRHTYTSEVKIANLPHHVYGVVRSSNNRNERIAVPIKDQAGQLTADSIPNVAIVKDGNYIARSIDDAPNQEADLLALIEGNLQGNPLAGFVVEGHSPFGTMTSFARERLMTKAVFCGMPVVTVGRGNNEGFCAPQGSFIGGQNLTATKARLLLMACLMRFGSLPTAEDPDRPTPAEAAATRDALDRYQRVFDSH